MVTVSDLYINLPVTITSDDVEKYNGVVLENEIAGDNNQKVAIFLDTVHSVIFDFLIYSTGEKSIKNAIIEKYPQVQTAIKKALLKQVSYLLESGNIELYNGLVKSVGNVAVVATSDVIEKIVAPSVINVLSSEKPNILFSGR